MNDLAYGNLTVNHQEYYVDLVTGAHTQATEQSQSDAKTKILKKMRGVSSEFFQSHHDHICWELMRKK